MRIYFKQFLIPIFAVLQLWSCKVSEKDIIGLYRLKNFPKTTFKLNADKTFEFKKINPNPYLHPFDHPDEYYFVSAGQWQHNKNRTIEVTSTKEALTDSVINFSVTAKADVFSHLSEFNFVDTYGDPVKILYVQYLDSSIVAAFHHSMDNFSEDITKRDTFEFHFYGYKPFTFIADSKVNQDYKFTLKPSFHPEFFSKTTFKVSRRKLIEIDRRAKFIKDGSDSVATIH